MMEYLNYSWLEWVGIAVVWMVCAGLILWLPGALRRQVEKDVEDMEKSIDERVHGFNSSQVQEKENARAEYNRTGELLKEVDLRMTNNQTPSSK
jgi:hypothetical protein